MLKWGSLSRLRQLFLRTTVVCACFLPPEMCVDQMKMVKATGMTPLRPASTLNGPGAMVWVRKRGENGEYISVGNLCGVRASLGADFVPVQSPTYRDELSKMIQRRFTIGAAVLEQITAEVTFRHISKISVAFENARIMTVSEDDVRAHMHKRSQECREAVAGRVGRGDEVTMIYSTLEGDLSYTVSWELSTSIDVQSKIDIISQLAARLGVGSSQVNEHTISSKALIWGVIDDTWLAEVSMKGAPPGQNVNADFEMVRKFDRSETRSIPKNVAIDLSDAPVAPVVESTNPENARYRYEP